MEDRFDVLITAIDKTQGNKEADYYLRVDTIANRALAIALEDRLKGVADKDQQVLAILHDRPDYHMTLTSDTFIRLVDGLGGVTVKGVHYNGRQALPLLKQGQYQQLVEAVLPQLKRLNMFTALPLINSVNETISSDISLMDLLKKAFSEIDDLQKWKIDVQKL